MSGRLLACRIASSFSRRPHSELAKKSTQSATTQLTDYERALVEIELDRATELALRAAPRAKLAPYSPPQTTLSPSVFPPGETFRLIGTKSHDEMCSREMFLSNPLLKLANIIPYAAIYWLGQSGLLLNTPLIQSIPNGDVIINVSNYIVITLMSLHFIQFHLLMPSPKTLASIFVSVNGNVALKFYQTRLNKFNLETEPVYIVLPTARQLITRPHQMGGIELAAFVNCKMSHLDRLRNFVLRRRLIKINKKQVKRLSQMAKQNLNELKWIKRANRLSDKTAHNSQRIKRMDANANAMFDAK